MRVRRKIHPGHIKQLHLHLKYRQVSRLLNISSPIILLPKKVLNWEGNYFMMGVYQKMETFPVVPAISHLPHSQHLIMI